jgi:hypothetical protein
MFGYSGGGEGSSQMQQHVEGDWMVAVAEALEAMVVRREHTTENSFGGRRRRGAGEVPGGEARQFISTVPFAAILGLAHFFPRITFPSRVFFFPFLFAYSFHVSLAFFCGSILS